MLKNGLLFFVSECLDHGFIPGMRYCGDDASDCLVVWNPDNSKSAFFGLMKDSHGEEVIVTYLIHLDKWQWAEDEGFTVNDVIFDDRLFDDVFTYIDGLHLAKELSS